MSSSPRFRLLEDGRWSGGGDVLLDNARDARAEHPILQGGREAIPIIARNVPTLGRYPKRPFVAIPQNAWVWTPVAKGVKERTLVTGLRVGTSVTYRLAAAVVRISEAVPIAATQPTSAVLHNVLDRGFDAASEEHDDEMNALCDGAFVCVGSNYAFRDLARLVRAHAVYRSRGGARRLVLIGPVGSQAAEGDLQGVLRGVGDSVVRRPVSSRSACLTAMRSAHGVVAPALVEASPVGVLEAGALASRVLLSDIAGHQGLVRAMGGFGQPQYFAPGDVEDLAQGLAGMDDATAGSWAPDVCSAKQRQELRERWATRLVDFLGQIVDRVQFNGIKEIA